MLTVDQDIATHHMHIGFARRVERLAELLTAIEQAAVDRRIRMDRDRSVAPVG